MKVASSSSVVAVASLAWIAGSAIASPLIVNPALPIREMVRVNVIRVADSGGGQAAPTFGTAAQQNAILAGVDTIWAQAGIDVFFKFRPGTWNNSFALGNAGTTTVRPDGDLASIVSLAQGAGVLDPDPEVLNLFQVRVVPGFDQSDDNTANGIAFIDGSGIGFWTGPALPNFVEGQEVVTKVLAHEIAHNLNLDHLSQAENLMQTGTGTYHDARLNASQVATAKFSQFARVRGDVNDDRTVNFADLLTLAQNYGLSTGRTPATGDFDYDGAVSFSDLLSLAQNYGYTLAGGSTLAGEASLGDGIALTRADGSNVPEPATAALAVSVVSTALRRQRRRR